MAFIWDKNTGKTGPARIKASLSPSYTLAELNAAADEYVAELEKKTKLYQTMLRLDLSHFTLWLAKREQGEGSEGDEP